MIRILFNQNCQKLYKILFIKMRALTDEETKIFFGKLAKFLGSNIKFLLDREDGDFVFRLHKERVYYINSEVLKMA